MVLFLAENGPLHQLGNFHLSIFCAFPYENPIKPWKIVPGKWTYSITLKGIGPATSAHAVLHNSKSIQKGLLEPGPPSCFMVWFSLKTSFTTLQEKWNETFGLRWSNSNYKLSGPGSWVYGIFEKSIPCMVFSSGGLGKSLIFYIILYHWVWGQDMWRVLFRSTFVTI